jgi:alpha-glucosidase
VALPANPDRLHPAADPDAGRPASGFTWWQRGVVYQIYPRSFMDSSGDGVGDLPGIAARLGHLAWLGIDALWISPVYRSPMADFGYDVADYTDIDPLFGTLADFDRLLAAAHGCGLKVVLDFVPNHSSDRHPWFIDSRASRRAARRDWYIWADPAAGGGPPNNWLSEFGGSAWSLDPATGQYYYHAYLPQQPDLNWRNPDLRAAMYDVMRFWLERGIDGFRVDAIHHVIKDDRLRDNPVNPDYRAGMAPHRRLLRRYTTDRPELMAVIAEMRAVLDAWPDRVLIGEAWLSTERLMAYYGENLLGFHMPFNFELIGVPWRAGATATLVAAYEALLPPGAWPNWVLGNHDRSRIASRIGPAQARVAAMLLLTLRGTPTLYYGDEIGMADGAIPPGRARDPWEKNLPGLGLGRDPERTPMQWDGSRHAGFSIAAPWLPIGADHRTVNVERETGDPGSMLSLYRALLALRRAEPALSVGSYAEAHADDAVFAYWRAHAGRRLLVALNLTDRAQAIALPTGMAARRLLSTAMDRAGAPADGKLDLRPSEGLVLAER